MAEGIEAYEVLDAMTRYGGGFASALAEAWRRADSGNEAKLRAAFPELWDKYAEFAALDAARRNKAESAPSA